MLIELSVKNFRSFQERMTLNVLKTAVKGPENYFLPHNFETELLTSVAIYGANASGKSNLLNAIRSMEKIVLHSANKEESLQEDISPFLFNKKTATEPSEFEVIFIAKDNIRYQYGFSATRKKIHEEWLYSYPEGKPRKLFDRRIDLKSEHYEWQFSKSLKGEKKSWQEQTRSDALFLSTAVRLNSEQLKPVYDWFKTTVKFIYSDMPMHEFTSKKCSNPEIKQQILNYIKVADLGIGDLNITFEKVVPENLPASMPKELKAFISEHLKNDSIEMADIETIHHLADGSSIALDFEEESKGTKQYFDILGPWLHVLNKGDVLFADELNSHLHPLLFKFLVEIFHNPKINKKGAQLIFTTHDTSILNRGVFRRDQIWFTEKNKDHATNLYSLSDFHPREEENLEKNYLSGKYGGVPNLQDINFAMSTSKSNAEKA
jgi:AAA15 family ATPase/GTPase